MLFYRDAQVQRLDSKVVSELSQYEDICKHAKEEVKHTSMARSQELARKKHLDRVREKNPRNRQQIVSFLKMLVEPCLRAICRT